MKKVLSVLGVLMLAQLIFVGMVHVLIRVQDKDSAETLESLHGMPVIGGFFMPPPPNPDELTADQVRDLKAVRRLRESLELYDLPHGFSREELETLTHELANARTENEQMRMALEQRVKEMESERREVETERARLMEFASGLTEKTESLQAKRAELAQRENVLLKGEERNLKVIRATYEKMEPRAAKDILDKMDVDLVAKILAGMSERNSARILQEFGNDGAASGGGKAKAVEITKRMMALMPDLADKARGGRANG